MRELEKSPRVDAVVHQQNLGGWWQSSKDDPEPYVLEWPFGGKKGQFFQIVRLWGEYEQEEDGRWLAEVMELPGAMAYGSTVDEAAAKVEALALRVLAERLEKGETPVRPFTMSFAAA